MTLRKSKTAVTEPEKIIDEKQNAKPTEETEEPLTSFASLREVIESLVFALFLAFLIKAYEAEAFVIPTGSMAPTLKGRHKDLLCAQCRFPFQVNASEEVDNTTNRATSTRVVAGTCPQCGCTQYFGQESPSFSGDRILVSKSAFDTRPLRRWDVSVFRAPAEPKINFIKRIVGLPNERVKVQYGDIFVQSKLANGQWSDYEITRKPLVYLDQMLQTVYDNDYLPENIDKTIWLKRWSDEMTDMKQGLASWIPSEDGRSFRYSGKTVPHDAARSERASLQLQTSVAKREIEERTIGVQWLRYRHIVPSSTDWFSLSEGKLPAEVERTGIIKNNPCLVTDMTAYNTGVTRGESNSPYGLSTQYVRNQCYLRGPESFGFNWTGDLAFTCDLMLTDLSQHLKGEIYLEMVKGGQAFRARLNPSAGQVSLEIPGVPSYPGEQAACSFRNGKNNIRFYNIDEQLRLVVNGKEVLFPNEGRYDDLCRPLSDERSGILPRNRAPNLQDLTPVSVGVRDIPVEIRHLTILRDIYYIAVGSNVQPVTGQTAGTYYESTNRRCDRLFTYPADFSTEEKIASFFSQPLRWEGYGRTHHATFELADNQYLAFGDNSGLSHDSRLWGSSTVPYYVDKKYLIGKAFYVYWPHSRMIPGTRLPLVPSFDKMRHID